MKRFACPSSSDIEDELPYSEYEQEEDPNFQEESEEETNEEFAEVDILKKLKAYKSMKNKVDEAVENGNFFQAVLVLSSILHMNGYDIDAYFMRCNFLIRMKQYQEAVRDARRILALDPAQTQGQILLVKGLIGLAQNSRLGNAYKRNPTQHHLTYYEQALAVLSSVDATQNYEAAALRQIILPHVNHFTAIADEILLKIFAHLCHNSLLVAACVSRQWKRVSADNCLWQNLYMADFQNNENLKHKSACWKLKYKSRLAQQEKESWSGSRTIRSYSVKWGFI